MPQIWNWFRATYLLVATYWALPDHRKMVVKTPVGAFRLRSFFWLGHRMTFFVLPELFLAESGGAEFCKGILSQRNRGVFSTGWIRLLRNSSLVSSSLSNRSPFTCCHVTMSPQWSILAWNSQLRVVCSNSQLDAVALRRLNEQIRLSLRLHLRRRLRLSVRRVSEWEPAKGSFFHESKWDHSCISP